MRKHVLAVLALAAIGGLSARPARADDDRVTIETVAPHSGREIRTPEGFLRVEEGPDLDDSAEVGTFVTYHPAALEAAAGEDTAPPWRTGPLPLRRDGLVDTAAPQVGSDPCRLQRGKYLKHLLAMEGIHVDRPLDLLDGLAGGVGGPAGNLLLSGYLTPGMEPLRPLAWDQELRSLARDLASCQARSTVATPPAPAR